jgi:hypothetical protein
MYPNKVLKIYNVTHPLINSVFSYDNDRKYHFHSPWGMADYPQMGVAKIIVERPKGVAIANPNFFKKKIGLFN